MCRRSWLPLLRIPTEKSPGSTYIDDPAGEQLQGRIYEMDGENGTAGG